MSFPARLGIEVRAATIADAPALCTLGQARAIRFGAAGFSPAYFHGRLAYALLSPQERVLVVTRRGRVVGALHAVLGESVADARPRLYVAGGVSFVGWGWLGLPAALREVRSWGRSLGAPTLVLTSCGLNTPWAFLGCVLGGAFPRGLFYEGSV